MPCKNSSHLAQNINNNIHVAFTHNSIHIACTPSNIVQSSRFELLSYITHLILFSRRGEVTEKPTVVADCSQFTFRVDKLDQLMAYYSFLHKSVKWWQKIWLLEVMVMVINTYIIYKELA